MVMQVIVDDVATVAGVGVYGVAFRENIPAPAVVQNNDIAIGMRNDLAITGNASNWTGTTDFLSGNFTTTYNNRGTMPTSGAFQAGLYINGTGTFNGVRGYVLHAENNAANTVNLFKGMEFVLTNNVGAITSLRWIDIPDTRSTPGGGTITQEWIIYNQNPNNKLETAGLIRTGKLDVTSTIASGVTNGFYLTGATQLALVTSTGVRFNFNSTGMSANSGRGPRITPNTSAGATTPTIIPDQTTPTAGFGADVGGNISLIASTAGVPVECLRITSTTLVEKVGKTLPTRVVTAAGAISAALSDQIIVVNKTIGSPTTLNLPASPATGQVFRIKDGAGDAATNPITLTPAAGTIDGLATLDIATNYGFAGVVYNGAQWNVI
ncbi:hypothetical protein BH09PSE2_BH09PSE2_20750 [soil metagenome]